MLLAGLAVSALASVRPAAAQAVPTITWGTPAPIVYGTPLSATQLNATASVPGTFLYTPPAGTVLNAGAHTLAVLFTPTDTVNYVQATAAVTLTVLQATPTLTWPTPAPIVYGTPILNEQLNATSNVLGTFGYSPPAGTFLPAGDHTLSVTFLPSDSVNYTLASASVTLTVLKATPTITWPTPAPITYPTPLSATQLNATASVPGTFAYTPPAGTVLSAGSDTLQVLFTPTDTANYTTAGASVTLTVLQATPTITWPTPAPITYPTPLSATQLNATASVPGTFVYAPPAGTVPNAGAQTLSVTFTPTDAVNYATATATVTLTVAQATPTITWATPAPIVHGTPLSAAQLNATASVPGTFVYTPPAGTVLGAGAQTLSVTFTPTDAVNYATATATVTLTVTQATPTITWATPAPIAYGTPLSATQLNATASVPGAFVYTPPAGTVLAAGAQTLSVTFTPTDTVNYTTATATVTLTVTQATPTITWATPAPIAYGTALSAAQLNATASVPGTFAYTPPAGTVLNAGAQTLSVTFTPTDAANYTTATATVTLTVTPATALVTWATPAPIVYGTPLSAAQLNATASVPGTFAYTPPAGTVLNAGAQTLSVTFTPTDLVNYAPSTTTVTLTVAPATPTITWATPAPIVEGTLLSATQLNATASVPGTFVYTPPAGTYLPAGSQTLSVTFTPTDAVNYTTATSSVTLVVTPAPPRITWTTPGGGDYDADSKADPTVFRPPEGAWYQLRSASSQAFGTLWGLSGDIPVPADYDGDGTTDVAVFRPSEGTWHLIWSSAGIGVLVGWGQPGDVPVPADYDGDAKADIAVFRPATGHWYIIQSSAGTAIGLVWGQADDRPVPADYDGDGKADPTVFRPSTGVWYQLRSATQSGFGLVWGENGDVPLAADYDGDGKADPTVFRPGAGFWYQVRSTGSVIGLPWGQAGDVPMAADYDGDGKADPTVFRPGTGTWLELRSTTSTGVGVNWGAAGDLPL
jgi:hypothetical protein